jgi:type IV secretory pathway VirB2 component (pilin)
MRKSEGNKMEVTLDIITLVMIIFAAAFFTLMIFSIITASRNSGHKNTK